MLLQEEKNCYNRKKIIEFENMIFNIAYLEKIKFCSIRSRDKIVILVVHLPLVLNNTQKNFTTNTLLVV